MRRNYFPIIKMMGFLLIGCTLISSVIFQTFFTFILGCMAWAMVITGMIYHEIRISKRGEIVKFKGYLTKSSHTIDDYSPANVRRILEIQKPS